MNGIYNTSKTSILHKFHQKFPQTITWNPNQYPPGTIPTKTLRFGPKIHSFCGIFNEEKGSFWPRQPLVFFFRVDSPSFKAKVIFSHDHGCLAGCTAFFFFGNIKLQPGNLGQKWRTDNVSTQLRVVASLRATKLRDWPDCRYVCEANQINRQRERWSVWRMMRNIPEITTLKTNDVLCAF